jgi:hypothetical protein
MFHIRRHVMRALRMAAAVAAVGFGLAVVGCGPEPTPSTPMDTAKMKERYEQGRQPRPTGTESAQPGDDLAAKVKALDTDVNEKLKPIEKAYASLADKIKEAMGDVKVTGPLLKTQMDVQSQIDDVKTQLKGLSSVKDQAAFETAEKKLREAVVKLDAALKDYMK